MKIPTLLFAFLALIALAACSPGPEKQKTTPHPNAVSPVLDLSASCEELLQNATWHNTTLYQLTYQCLPTGWETFFQTEKIKSEIKRISDELAQEVASGYNINPSIGHTFRAMYLVSPVAIRSVIMGQDPAPQPGLATGLSFSLSPDVPTSSVASVQRVFLEVQNEGNCVDLDNGSLLPWTQQGVLLLNMALTIPCPDNDNFCEIGKHIPLWESFTHDLVEYMETQTQPMVYLLWGSQAGYYADLVTREDHAVYRGGHPSPKADGSRFFCHGYFKKTNDYLEDKGVTTVDWSLIKSCSKQPACIWEWHSAEDGKPGYSTCEKPC